jgi:hypothetical protein
VGIGKLTWIAPMDVSPLICFKSNHISCCPSPLVQTIGTIQGIRQALEKKEGLFRKNIMGKRVNFAARCVYWLP